MRFRGVVLYVFLLLVILVFVKTEANAIDWQVNREVAAKAIKGNLANQEK